MAFLPSPPAGIERVNRAEAAGCGYWKRASEGRAFYTAPDDHGNCPVGAYTHGVELTPEKGQELQSLVGTMIELKYLTSDEVPAIPRRTSPMKVAAYAPLANATFNPDVVVFRGNARQIMLLSEAARAASVLDSGAVMGRPACAMIPQTIDSMSSVASVGCIGNRVYTGLGDDELYLTVPGAKVGEVLEKLSTILTANRELEKFHRQRAATLS
jgi:uncharacterized protein (DUF169 family)